MPIQSYRSLIVCLCASLAWSQQAPTAASGGTGSAATNSSDPIAVMVGRLELNRYKAKIKGLTQFGDRRQGTDRNRAAVDWIEAQLKSYGCTNTERIRYDYQPTPGTGTGRRAGDPSMGPGGSRRRGNIFPDTVNNDPMKQPDVKLRELNSQPSTPGPREEVYCTKIGRSIRNRCTSSGRTWTELAGAKQPTTMVPEPRW
jgi:hypothetical protein